MRTFPAPVWALVFSLAGCPAGRPPLPAFADFPVAGVGREAVAGHAEPRATRASLPERGRDALDAAPRVPDFAGHYRIVSWGCGSPCHVHAAVNVETGAIVAVLNSALDLAYRLDSRLILANPPEAIREVYDDPETALVSETRAYVLERDTLYAVGAWSAW